MHIRTKELPKIGAFGHARNFLYGEKLWEIKVQFVEKIDNLGVSYDDRVRTDVIAFGPEGRVGGWNGRYGGSYAMMYSKDTAALATGGKLDLQDMPEDHVILEITRHWKSSWVRMYLNPIHQAKLLPAAPEGIDIERMKNILKVFRSYISSARQTPLHSLKVTQEEFNLLVERGWLKCHKGKTPEILPKAIYIGKGYDQFKYYELNGATLTTEGKNFC